MSRDLDRIVVDVPVADSSRHRVEPRMFDRLDAIRAAERAKDVAPDRSARRWPWIAVAAAITAAAAITIILATHGRESTRPSAPSLVVTPSGGSSRFTIDDAVIDAGSDTSVAVQSGDHGAVTLVLARGTIDCEVAPRNGRPFHVIAGDVDVEVVGTRFAVTRGTSVRVDVTHGRVRVRSPNGESMVGAGERWPLVAPTPNYDDRNGRPTCPTSAGRDRTGASRDSEARRADAARSVSRCTGSRGAGLGRRCEGLSRDRIR